MPDRSDITENAKAIVHSFYSGAAQGKITDFAGHLAERFELYVPAYLPWGGRFDKAGYVERLPEIARVLDFTRLHYLSFVAEGGHVVALIAVGIHGTDDDTIISEHWDIVDNKVVSLRVAYFDPTTLIQHLTAKTNV